MYDVTATAKQGVPRPLRFMQHLGAATMFLAALATIFVPPAWASSTVKLSAAEKQQLTTFLSAYAATEVGDFSVKAGPSDTQLALFATRHLAMWDPYPNGVLSSTDSGFRAPAAAIDAVDREYFGRTVRARKSSGSQYSAITYRDGAYFFGPFDKYSDYARVVKATTSKPRVWTVYLQRMELYEGDKVYYRPEQECVATVRLGGSEEPTYTLTGWKTQKVRVPYVKGLFFTNAQSVLKYRGFKVRSTGVYAGNGGLTTDGTVYKQSHRAGTFVPKGTVIRIWWGYERS